MAEVGKRHYLQAKEGVIGHLYETFAELAAEECRRNNDHNTGQRLALQGVGYLLTQELSLSCSGGAGVECYIRIHSYGAILTSQLEALQLIMDQGHYFSAGGPPSRLSDGDPFAMPRIVSTAPPHWPSALSSYTG